jgi:hypothetical protein
MNMLYLSPKSSSYLCRFVVVGWLDSNVLLHRLLKNDNLCHFLMPSLSILYLSCLSVIPSFFAAAV